MENRLRYDVEGNQYDPMNEQGYVERCRSAFMQWLDDRWHLFDPDYRDAAHSMIESMETAQDVKDFRTFKSRYLQHAKA